MGDRYEYGHVKGAFADIKCALASAECGGYDGVDCGGCDAGKTCVNNKCVEQFSLPAQKVAQYASMGSSPLPTDREAYCLPNGKECGMFDPGPGEVDCGGCPSGKTCSANKCVSQFQAAVAKLYEGVKSEVPAPKPLPVKTAVKLLFKGQPYLQALLGVIFDQLAPVTRIPEEGKTPELIATWMTDKGFTNIVAAAKWGGYEQEFTGVKNYCAQVNVKNLPYPVTQAMCNDRLNKFLSLLGEKCSSTYTSDYLSALEQAKENEQQDKDPYLQGDPTDPDAPTPQKTSSALPWVLGIGAVLAAAGAVVYFSNKPEKPNPVTRRRRR